MTQLSRNKARVMSNYLNTGYQVTLVPKFAFGSVYHKKVQKALMVNKEGMKIFTKSMGIGQDVNPRKAWKYLMKQTDFYKDMVSRIYAWQALVARGHINEDNLDDTLDFFNKENAKLKKVL